MDFEIVDINCGLGYPVGVRPRFHDLNGLLQVMDTYRISKSVAFHMEALRDVVMGNQLALDAAGKSGGVLHPATSCVPIWAAARFPHRISC